VSQPKRKIDKNAEPATSTPTLPLDDANKKRKGRPKPSKAAGVQPSKAGKVDETKQQVQKQVAGGTKAGKRAAGRKKAAEPVGGVDKAKSVVTQSALRKCEEEMTKDALIQTLDRNKHVEINENGEIVAAQEVFQKGDSAATTRRK
jgi:hypothetical protein